MLLEQFYFLFFCGCSESIHPSIWITFPTYTPPLLLKSTSSKLYPHYFIIAYFSPIFPFLNTISNATSSTLAIMMQHLCFLHAPYHASGQQMLTNPLPREQRTSQVWKVPKAYAFAHILSLLATNLINISGLILTMSKSWIFLLVVKS